MARRGPRGDIDQQVIVNAAMQLLQREGSIAAVSLRMVAREVGVAPNAIYTYFPTMATVWNEAKEQLLQQYGPFVADTDCGRCGLRSVVKQMTERRANSLVMLELYELQQHLGAQSFHFAEAVMGIASNSPLPSHAVRNLVLIWMTGRTSLRRQHTLVPERREAYRRETGLEFPLEAAANQEPTDDDIEIEITALLNSLQLPCSCGRDAESPFALER